MNSSDKTNRESEALRKRISALSAAIVSKLCCSGSGYRMISVGAEP